MATRTKPLARRTLPDARFSLSNVLGGMQEELRVEDPVRGEGEGEHSSIILLAPVLRRLGDGFGGSVGDGAGVLDSK